MSLKPIDLQIMVPKTTEIGKIHHQREFLQKNEQHILAQSEQKRMEHQQQQVQNSPASLKAANDNKKHKREDEQQQRKIVKEEDSIDVHNNLDPIRGQYFDVRI